MSLKDRWYMWRDTNGKRLEHNPTGCSCAKCELYKKLNLDKRGAQNAENSYEERG